MVEPIGAISFELPAPSVLEARRLSVRAGARTLVAEIDLAVRAREVLALIGPSGAGKTTLLKAFNRLHELTPGLRVEGDILLHGESILAPHVDADALRGRLGMLFQSPVLFAGSIYQNTVFGLRHASRVPRAEWRGRAEKALREAALWEEVKDRLETPAGTLSAGQQQRLCLARALALEPEVLLMDEPTSALDPRSTAAIERLIGELTEHRTVVLVTHDLAQARRVAHRVAALFTVDGVGRLVEQGEIGRVFSRPRDARLVEYLSTHCTPGCP